LGDFVFTPEIPRTMSILSEFSINQLILFVSVVIETMHSASGVTAVIETMEKLNHHSPIPSLHSLLSTSHPRVRFLFDPTVIETMEPSYRHSLLTNHE
jgi:hypothetical protein